MLRYPVAVERNLTAHEPNPPLPCLCKACLAAAPLTATVEGLTFKRLEVRAASRVLHAWYAEELDDELPRLRASMERRLAKRYQTKWSAMQLPPPASAKSDGLFDRLRRFLGV